jgi:hypothetical protein
MIQAPTIANRQREARPLTLAALLEHSVHELFCTKDLIMKKLTLVAAGLAFAVAASAGFAADAKKPAASAPAAEKKVEKKAEKKAEKKVVKAKKAASAAK